MGSNKILWAPSLALALTLLTQGQGLRMLRDWGGRSQRQGRGPWSILIYLSQGGRVGKQEGWAELTGN